MIFFLFRISSLVLKQSFVNSAFVKIGCIVTSRMFFPFTAESGTLCTTGPIYAKHFLPYRRNGAALLLKNSLYKLLQSGEIQHIKVGRKYLIPKVYLLDFIEKNR